VKDYVSVVYNVADKPFTQYPDQLTAYLVERYKLRPQQKLLDLGCGRGEFLRGFSRCGLDACGADQSLAAKRLCPEADIRTVNFETSPIPFGDCEFDVVYSKSFIEHFYYPEKVVCEIYRVLRPGGMVITMTPDWEHNVKIFYEDYTHRTPFTLSSLRDIQLIHGFEDVRVERFRQLPFLWRHPWMKPLSQIVALTTPRSASKHSKLVRFSKEVMLLATGIKPLKQG
jgi:ubiquinone/menaquinone biosynthesis C-methylase UbiE